MFWKIILVIYVVITVVAFGLFLLSIIEGAHKVRRRHPDLLQKHQRDRVALFGALLRGMILCSLPIYHIVLLIGYTLIYDDVVNNAVNDAVHDLQEEQA